MSIPYVIKQADIDRATANGVSLRGGSGQVLAVGDTVAIGSPYAPWLAQGRNSPLQQAPLLPAFIFPAKVRLQAQYHTPRGRYPQMVKQPHLF